MARLIAASTRSLGMFTLLAFWKQRRRAALVLGSGPPAFTAIAISLPMRVNCLAIRSQRANIEALRTSKILPIVIMQFDMDGDAMTGCIPGCKSKAIGVKEKPP